MNGTTWTPEKTDGALRLRGLGHSASEISEEFDTTKNAVLGKFRRLGLSEKGKNPHWSPEKRARFKRMWLDGLPASHIAQEMGCKSVTVHGRRKRMSLPSQTEMLQKTNGSRVVTLP